MALLRAAETAPYLGKRSHPVSQAISSPNEAYMKLKALPFDGYLAMSSANVKAVLRQRSPASANEKQSEGPEYLTATPISAKIPAPIVVPIP